MSANLDPAPHSSVVPPPDDADHLVRDEFDRLLADHPHRPDDWRSTVGMFSNNPLVKEIDAAGAAWRQADRDAARRDSDS